jgi:hypothetical protein
VTVATTARPALRSILTKQTVAPVIVVGGIDASVLPSPKRKVRKTSHQEQICKQNERKRKAVHAQAHARATSLVAEEELEVLLRWKGVPMSTMGNVANRRTLYQQFAEGGVEEVCIVPALWSEIDEAELIALRDGPIVICDTMYGRFEEQKKSEMERAYQKMTAAEKEVFKQKMAEYDEADADDGETPPSTPTPI